MDHFQEAHEQDDGKQTVLIFRNGLQNIVKEALQERDFSDDTAVSAKAAKIVRRDMFSHKGLSFSGTFPLGCQEISLPASLKSLIMIMNGLNVKDQENKESHACLTVCQTVLFNAKRRSCSSLRHSALREPPLPIYISLDVHSLTRCKKLITELYQLGLSVSYDRLMEIEDWLATAVAKRFEEDGCVSPVCLKKGFISVGALDNLDHNPSSTTGTSSFQGTGISVFSFLQRVILVRDVSQSQYFLLVQTSIQFLTARQLSHQLNLRQQLHQSQKGKCMRSIAQQKCSTVISPGLKTLQSGFFGWQAQNNVIGNQYFIGLMECQKCLLEKNPPSVWKNR